jgi:hypothetical protein
MRNAARKAGLREREAMLVFGRYDCIDRNHERPFYLKRSSVSAHFLSFSPPIKLILDSCHNVAYPCEISLSSSSSSQSLYSSGHSSLCCESDVRVCKIIREISLSSTYQHRSHFFAFAAFLNYCEEVGFYTSFQSPSEFGFLLSSVEIGWNILLVGCRLGHSAAEARLSTLTSILDVFIAFSLSALEGLFTTQTAIPHSLPQ